MKRPFLQWFLTIAIAFLIAACCTLQVSRSTTILFSHVGQPQEAGSGIPKAGLGESASYATATTLPSFCPHCDCDDCLAACPNGDECPPVRCAKVDCINAQCIYSPLGTPECPHFDGQPDFNSTCLTGIERWIFVNDVLTWDCGDCPSAQGHDVLGCDPDSGRTAACTPAHHAWELRNACSGNQTCKEGVCGCDCTAAAAECIDETHVRVCGPDCWTTQPCPIGSKCQGNQCLCQENDRRCVSPQDPPELSAGGRINGTLVCQGGKWVGEVTCGPGLVCADGRCKSVCPPGQKHCSRENKCVPDCDANKCEVLSSATMKCETPCPREYCKAGKCTCIPVGGGLCLAGPTPAFPPIPIYICN